jgi:hypothetical protein
MNNPPLPPLQPRDAAPLITAASVSRLAGALVTTLLVYTALLSGDPLFRLAAIVLACPAIAIGFSLPRVAFGSYLWIGLASAVLVATLVGAERAQNPGPRHELTEREEFLAGFVGGAFFSVFGLAVAGLIFSLVRTSVGMIIQRRPDSRYIGEVRKWLALVLPLAAVVVWVLNGFLFLWVPVVAVLASLYIWPPGRDPWFETINRSSWEGLEGPELSDREHHRALAREQARCERGA